MKTEDQVELVKAFMLQIAGPVAEHCLRVFSVIPAQDAEEAHDIRRRISQCAGETTLEIASHLAAKFASYEYEALDFTATDTAAAAVHHETRTEPAVPAGPNPVSEESPVVSDLPRERLEPSPPSSRTSRRGT